MKGAFFLTLFATTSLLACSKREDTHALAAMQAVAPMPEPSPTPNSEPVAPAAASAPADTTPGPAARSDLAHGQQIYRQSCAFCHDKGVAGAPVIGDAAAWSPRLAKGMDALYASALRGKGAMPAKGGNPALADDNVKAAVNYLGAQAR